MEIKHSNSLILNVGLLIEKDNPFFSDKSP